MKLIKNLGLLVQNYGLFGGRMRVLHVFGGLRTFKIAKWQALNGMRIDYVVFEDPKPFESYYKNTGMEIHVNKRLTNIYGILRKKGFFIRLHFPLYIFYIRLIGNVIKKSRPNIIHCYRHTGAFITIIAKKMYGLGKAKIVFDYQDPWCMEESINKSFLHKIIVKMFYILEGFIVRNSDFIITQGEEQTKILTARYNIQSEINHTWNTADEKLFKTYSKERIELRKKYGLNNSVAILYLGSIIKYYGIHLIPEAAKEIVKDFPDVKFVMMGVIRDVKYWELIKKKVKDYGLDRNFIEIYPAKKDEIPKLISACDIGLITHMKGSYICEVAIPTKLFEYMTCGLAVLTSNLKHITNFVIPEKSGITFEPNNPKSLANSLKILLKNPSLMKNLGINARKAVVKKFNWDIEMNKLLNVYKALLKVEQ